MISGQAAKRVKITVPQSVEDMIEKKAMIFLFILLVGIAIAVGIILALSG